MAKYVSCGADWAKSCSGISDREREAIESIEGKSASELTPADEDAIFKRALIACLTRLHQAAELLMYCSDEEAEHYDSLYQAADSDARDLALLMDEHWDHSGLIQSARKMVTFATICRTPQGRLIGRSRDETTAKTYIAQNPMTGMIKIGRSKNPGSRMTQLITGSGVKPKILLVIDSDVERMLHKTFAHLRYGGEWFIDDGSIAEFVEQEKLKRGNE